MKQLLISISLDSFYQILHLDLVFLAHMSVFLSKLDLNLSLNTGKFLRLLLFNQNPDFFSIDIIFDLKVNFFLFSQVNDLFGPFVVVLEFLSVVLKILVYLVDVLQFKRVNHVEGRLLVVLHVLVPGFREQHILDLLILFDVDEFAMLSNFHVVLLSVCLIQAPSLEHFSVLVGHQIVVILFILSSGIVDQLKESDHSLIR